MNAVLFRDLLMNMLLGLTALTVIMLASLNPPQKDEEAAQQPGNLAITMCWPEGNYDVDLWVKAPGDDKPVGYSNRGSKTLNLLRDDLGTANDSMPVNCENVFSRGLPDGEWIVNVHAYKTPVVPLKVKLEARVTENGKTKGPALDATVTLVQQGQEVTAMRFRMRGGKIDMPSVNRAFAPLRAAKKP